MSYFIEISQERIENIMFPYKKAGFVIEDFDKHKKKSIDFDLKNVKFKTLKGSNLPLEIRKNLKENLNCKFVKSDPDYYVYSNKKLNSLVNTLKLVHIDYFLESMEYDLGKESYWDVLDAELKKIKKENPDCYVLYRNFYFNHKNGSYKLLSDLKHCQVEKTVVYSKNKEIFDKIFYCESILNTDLIIKGLDGSKIINKEDYFTLNAMLNSKNKQDIDLAINIIISSDWEKSYSYIALLLSFNDNLNYKSVPNTSLGKAFNEYFSNNKINDFSNISLISYYFRVLDAIRTLKKKNLYDSNIKSILNYLINNYIKNETLLLLKKSDEFEINDIDFVTLKID